MSTREIAAGDTPDPETTGSNWGGVENDMSAAGWQCDMSLTKENKTDFLIQDRPVTRLVDVTIDGNTIKKFEAYLDFADSDLLVSEPGSCATKYIWTIQLQNSVIIPPYKQEKDIEIRVRTGLVST